MLNKIIFAILLTAYAVASQDYHDTLDDNIVFENLPSSDIKEFLYCLMDKGPCTDVMESYKQHLISFIEEECARCSKCQKHMTYVFWNRLQTEFPEDFEEYRAMYDPENRHFDNIYAKVSVEKDKSYC